MQRSWSWKKAAFETENCSGLGTARSSELTLKFFEEYCPSHELVSLMDSSLSSGIARRRVKDATRRVVHLLLYQNLSD